MTDLDQHLDNILKASGSGLRNYSMQKTIDDMRKALSAAIAEEREACAKECEYIAQESDSFTENILRATATQIRARGEA